MELRKLESALRQFGGESPNAPDHVVANHGFRMSDVLIRAKENLDAGLSVADAVSEACDAYGHDYDAVMAFLDR